MRIVFDFQASRYGGEYTVNLGFHYSFVPPLFHSKRIPTCNFHLLDCMFKARIGFFLPDKRDTWYQHGNDVEQLKVTFRDNTAVCFSVFKRFATLWQDPARWFKGNRRGPEQPWRSDDFDLLLACVEIHRGRYKSGIVRLQSRLELDLSTSKRRLIRSVLAKARRRSG